LSPPGEEEEEEEEEEEHVYEPVDIAAEIGPDRLEGPAAGTVRR
jgi:hypothetical protein